MQTPNHERVLTDLDHARLDGLLARLSDGALPQAVEDAAQDIVDSAVTVPAQSIEADVVTMRSRVKLCDDAGQETVLTLVYPQESDAAAGRFSILSPLGLALIGNRVGQAIQWQGPNGASHQARLAEILYQPEAARDFGV